MCKTWFHYSPGIQVSFARGPVKEVDIRQTLGERL